MPSVVRDRPLVRSLGASLLCALLTAASAVEAAVSDDFSDGNDTSPAWWHFAPIAGAAFDASSLSYLISVPATGNALDPARAFSLREDASYGDTVVAADLVAFDNFTGHYYGIVARSTSSGAPTHDGYALVVSAPGTLALLQIDDQIVTTLATGSVSLDTGVDYRLVLSVAGTGPALLSGRLAATSDPGNPIATVSYSDSIAPIHAAGSTGVLLADGSALQDQIVSGTFDEFFASAPSADTDEDGLSDGAELSLGTDPSDTDTDDDGLLDKFEVNTHGTNPTLADTDGDGLRDGFEVMYGFNPLVGGEQGQDLDADGATNLQEQNAGSKPNVTDTDGDGLGDGAELNTHGTSPTLTDTDGDGLLDGFELAYGFNPIVAGEQGEDADADGITNVDEQELGTNPTVVDTDGDGLSDFTEVVDYGTDPTLADTDGDGLGDTAELITHGTNPFVPDTDGDNLLDGFEVAYGFNPLVAGEQAQNPDADGLTNFQEQALGTNPTLADTDGDGLSDGTEVNTHGTSPLVADMDGDGLSDGAELITHGSNPFVADTDGDGLIDGVEVNTYGTSPTLVDSDSDGLSDPVELNVYGTNPNLADTDDDGLLDAQEIDTGMFGAPLEVSSAAYDVSSAIAGDVDGDGDMDVLSATKNDDRIAWYENDGTPFLGGWPERAISYDADGAGSVFAADVDGDGDTDVLSASFNDDTIAWYENDGTPSVGAWTEHAISTAADSAISVTAADVDGDGDMDVVCNSSSTNAIAWYENDGTPGLGAWTEHAISTIDAAGNSVVTADLDGDGDTDVLAGANRTIPISYPPYSAIVTLSWFENDGTPGEGAWSEHIMHWYDSWFGGPTYRHFLADVDGDGDADVVYQFSFDADGTGGIVYRVIWAANDGTPAEGYWPSTILAPYIDGGGAASAADVDGDGDMDVLAPGTGGVTTAWYENDGTPSIGAWVAHAISTAGGSNRSVLAADFDGDGDTDVLRAPVNNTIRLYEQQNVTDPLDADTDDDGLIDGAEQNVHGTNSKLPDTDGDGLLDGFEVTYTFDPLVPGQQGLDHDFDGLTTLDEQTAGSNPRVADTDGDLFLDGSDNCPVTANPTQSDIGSVLAEPADGVGDACQCGDVDDSGIVDFVDVDAYRDSLADPVGLPLTPAGVAKCSVIDSAGPCEILDVTVIQRALEPVPLFPGIAQVCSAAGGL